jgi:hypothetical protein
MIEKLLNIEQKLDLIIYSGTSKIQTPQTEESHGGVQGQIYPYHIAISDSAVMTST